MEAKRKRSEHPMRRAKSPLQTVYLDKDLVKPKLPLIHSKQESKEEESKKTRTFSLIAEKSFNIRTVGGKRHGKKGRKGAAVRSENGEEVKKTEEDRTITTKVEEKKKYVSKLK